MPITNYATLLTAVADHVAREDLADFVPDFVTMAEDWLNYGSEDTAPLRCREMETTATLTMTDGAGTVPTNFLQTISVIEDGSSLRRTLTYITPQAMDELYPIRASGVGYYYTIVGSTLQTAPEVSNDVILTYYRTLPPLYTSGSNWLMTRAPGIYLRATLAQAYIFTRDTAEASTHAAMAKALISGMNKSDMVGRYARAGTTIRGCTP